jgi:hypothetical protein
VSTLAPVPTVDAASGLTTFQSDVLPYSLNVPSGWTHEVAQNGLDRFYMNREGGTLLSELTVACKRTLEGGGVTPEELIDEDLKLLAASPVRVSSPVITDLEASDRAGKMMVYRHAAAGVPISILVAYFADEGCGWRVRMNVYGEGQEAEYEALFRRIAGTLDPEGDLEGGDERT